MLNDLLCGEISDFDKIKKPWGYEVIWAKSALDTGYVGKLLSITAGHRLSLQFHKEKEETIFVKSGVLYLETIGYVTELGVLRDHFSGRKVLKLFPERRRPPESYLPNSDRVDKMMLFWES